MTNSTISQSLDDITVAFRALLGEPIDLWIFLESSWHHTVDPFQGNCGPAELETVVILPESLPQEPHSLEETLVEELAPGMFRI
ncbi:MAG: hypothetical protein JWM11_4525, partial [Planctomycetaceae bacterium]|nr:hypothetical protein [Planctomycetaceae bacterium]